MQYTAEMINIMINIYIVSDYRVRNCEQNPIWTHHMDHTGPAVIGHGFCSVLANVLSVWPFVCLFFGDANKLKYD